MKRRRNRRQRAALRSGLLLLAGIVLLVLLYQGGRWLERRGQKPETRGDYRARYAYEPTVEYDGVSYRRRTGLTTILLMGVDQAGDGQSAGYRSGGQADFLRLLVLDSADEKVMQVQIDRDTMTPITILGVLGDRAGIRTAQISLSHGFGDGAEQSCELTVDAVSNLLLGVPIDFYVAMDMDGIPVLNDQVGGVTVTLEDDFSALDPAMVPGATLTLTGAQAELYVRGRMEVGDGTNAARMARQEKYLSQLAQVLDGKLRENQDSIGELYDALKPHLVTDLSRGRLINEVWAAKDYERAALIELEGSHQVGGDGFMQFYVDEAALRRKVLELFYQKVV